MHYKTKWLLILFIVIFAISGCSKNDSESDKTDPSDTTEVTTTETPNTEPDIENPSETQIEEPTEDPNRYQSIYKDRPKISLTTYNTGNEPLKLFLNMNMQSVIEVYGEPLSKFYFTGSLVYEYPDFYVFFDGPYYEDEEMMNREEMIAMGFWFKLNKPVFGLSLGMSLYDIETIYGPMDNLSRSEMSEFSTEYVSVFSLEQLSIMMMFEKDMTLRTLFVLENIEEAGSIETYPLGLSTEDRIQTIQTPYTFNDYGPFANEAFDSAFQQLKAASDRQYLSFTQKGIYYNVMGEGFFLLDTESEVVRKLSTQNMILLDDGLDQLLVQDMDKGYLYIISKTEQKVSQYGYLNFHGTRDYFGFYYSRLK